MNKKILPLIVLSFGVVISAVILIQNKASAQNDKNISYPIAELGNCKDKADCRNYCDIEKNVNACLNFAEKNKMMAESEIQVAKKMQNIKNGPGGCNSKKSCEEYCDDISHISQCLSFAEQNNILPPDELEEAKKIKAAIDNGVKPPACKNKTQCDEYCANSDHIEECITFASQAGLMKEEEKADAQKMLQAIKKGAKPPRCSGKESCDKYCAEESHAMECIAFAEAAGFMSAEDAQMAKKTGGKGPGGCRGKEECDSFCKNPENQETCFNFAKDLGLISQEDLKKMEDGKAGMQKNLNDSPQEFKDCVKNAIGEEKYQKLQDGTMMPSEETGKIMENCGKQFNGPPKQDFNDFINTKTPAEVRECVRTNLNPNIFNENKDNHEEIDRVMRDCFSKLPQNQQQQNFPQQFSPDQQGQMMQPPYQGPMPSDGQMPPNPQDFPQYQNMPPPNTIQIMPQDMTQPVPIYMQQQQTEMQSQPGSDQTQPIPETFSQPETAPSEPAAPAPEQPSSFQPRPLTAFISDVFGIFLNP